MKGSSSRTWFLLADANGGKPHRRMYATTPNAHKSTFKPYLLRNITVIRCHIFFCENERQIFFAPFEKKKKKANQREEEQKKE
jgi:hypothetical protein